MVTSQDRCEHDGDIGGHAEMGNLLDADPRSELYKRRLESSFLFGAMNFERPKKQCERTGSHVAYRVCRACFYYTPALLGQMYGLFLSFPDNVAPSRESHKVPTEEIAGAMEAVEVTMAVDDDNNVTVAEPDEEELPEAIAEPEQEQSAEVDFDEGYDDDEKQERHPVLVIENIRHIERIAASAQVALQTPYFPSHRSAICVDPHQLAYTYMSFLRLCRCIPTHWKASANL